SCLRLTVVWLGRSASRVNEAETELPLHLAERDDYFGPPLDGNPAGPAIDRVFASAGRDSSALACGDASITINAPGSTPQERLHEDSPIRRRFGFGPVFAGPSRA